MKVLVLLVIVSCAVRCTLSAVDYDTSQIAHLLRTRTKDAVTQTLAVQALLERVIPRHANQFIVKVMNVSHLIDSEWGGALVCYSVHARVYLLIRWTRTIRRCASAARRPTMSHRLCNATCVSAVMHISRGTAHRWAPYLQPFHCRLNHLLWLPFNRMFAPDRYEQSTEFDTSRTHAHSRIRTCGGTGHVGRRILTGSHCRASTCHS